MKMILLDISGPKGDRAGNLAIQNSDFILILGSSLHSMKHWMGA